ncbi:MAG: ABC transporter permease [Lachnospiraceae bacterium]|nr:ABC transporter permease [Lachnospiraceae bacterium]
MEKKNIASMIRSFALVFIIIAICIVMTIVSPVFMTSRNIINIIRQISINGIIAVGMTFVILLGCIDLSVGSIVAITSVICGFMLQAGYHWLVACIVALIVSIIFGCFNGFLIAYVNFQPFIATLATVTMGSGIALAFSDGKPYTISDPAFLAIGQGYVGAILIPIILLVIVVAVGLVILNMTTFGRYVFAIGGNENAAKLSGIRTKRVKLAVYVISAICASIVGMILSARISSGQPTAGDGYELDAIAATAIGGTSMNGGIGSLTGTIFGFILLGLLTNSMNLLNINSFYQQIAKGILIIIAVFIDMTSKGKSR